MSHIRDALTDGGHDVTTLRVNNQSGTAFDLDATEEQILDECTAFTTLLQKVYKDFGFTDIIYKVATRPDKRVGGDESWDKAEHALMESLRQSGVAFDVSPGEEVVDQSVGLA